MPQRVRAAALVAAILIIFTLQCRQSGAATEDPADVEALDRLAAYMRVDTSNPPGNETAGSTLLSKFLEEAGIHPTLIGSDPQRQSLYARLESGSSEPALLLLHHIDVVPAIAAEWTVPPFSATTNNGYLWGRGAIDVKSLGVAHLQAFLDLKKSGAVLNRDVIFLAAADEEAGSTLGLEALLKEHPDLFEGIGFVLNEGGANETVVDEVRAWGIERAQKVPLWIRITARAKGGHGAAPPEGGGAVVRLLEILQDLRARPTPLKLVPSVKEHFTSIASHRTRGQRGIFADPEKYFGTPQLEAQLSPSYRALLADTMAITTLDAGNSVNSVPSTAHATIDYRLLPGSSGTEELTRIEETVGDRGVIEVLLHGRPSPPSPLDTPLWRVLSEVLTQREKGSSLVPMVTAGTTDSRFLRERGMVAYGFSPFKLNYYDADTIHGVDERIRIRFFTEGVRTMKQVVRAFATRAP